VARSLGGGAGIAYNVAVCVGGLMSRLAGALVWEYWFYFMLVSAESAVSCSKVENGKQVCKLWETT
jgi:hypothetical protein